MSNTVFGYNFLHHQGLRNHLMDDVFEPSLASIRDAGFELTRVIYNPLIGMWTLAAGRAYGRVRLLSTTLNVITLIFFFLIACRLANSAVGLIAVFITAVHPFFFSIGLLIRPESFLLCAAAALLWLDLQIDSSWDLKPLILGCLAGLCIGVHQNIMVFFPGLLFFHLSFCKPVRRWPEFFYFCGGFIVGVLGIIVWIDLKKLLLTPLAFHLQFYRAPLLSWPWHPWSWTKATFLSMFQGETYYFSATGSSLWSQCIRLSFLLVIVGFAGNLFRTVAPSSPRRRLIFSLSVALLAGFSWLTLFVQRKEPLYFAIVFPFMIPLAALGLWQIRQKNVGAFALLMILFLGPFAMLLTFAHRYTSLAMPQQTVISRLETIIGDPAASVLGPAPLWFGWPSPHFRDAGAVTFSYIYSGHLNMVRWLEPWRPSIIIADKSWSQMFLKDRRRADRLGILLGNRPVKLLGTVDTGLAMGLLDVYRIQWDN